MKIAVFSAKSYDRESLAAAAGPGEELRFLEARLDERTAPAAAGCEAVCAFVNDVLDAAALGVLARAGVRFVALRCAGFNNLDVPSARRLGLRAARVPEYSPHAVAEHAVALMLALNRKTHRAYNRVREGNFALDGLLGFDMHGKTAGLVGTGRIGTALAAILAGFGCQLLGHDPAPSDACRRLGMEFVALPELLRRADLVSLHCPLVPNTRHLLGAEAFGMLKPGAMVVNTSRGGVLDTRAAIAALKSGRLGSLGLDVYEEEAAYFFEDRSDGAIADDVLARLLTFPNVLVTGHQGFLTREALAAIAATTFANLRDFVAERVCPNELR